MFNGANLTLNSDLALVFTQVKCFLYMSEAYTTGHWKINKTFALLLLIGGCSACADPEGRTGGTEHANPCKVP